MNDKSIPNRVVARFIRATGEPIDDRMKALLLKLRKGADASLSFPQLLKVLALLGGWEVKPIVGTLKMHGYDGKYEDKPSLLAGENEAAMKSDYERLKVDTVTSLPASPKEGQRYVMDLEPFSSWTVQGGTTLYGATYRMWLGVPGYRFRDPEGKTFDLLPGKYDATKDRKNLRPFQVLPWIKKETTYLAQINELLGMEPHEKAAPRTRDHTGTCAVCFRNIKLKESSSEKVMALHGYNRPGHGYVIGKCWGGAYQPYELSCEATKRILKAVNETLENALAYAKEVRKPGFDSFNQNRWDVGAPAKILRKSEMPEYAWKQKLETHQQEADSYVRGVEKEKKIYKWLIDNWEIRELPREGERVTDWFEIALIKSR